MKSLLTLCFIILLALAAPRSAGAVDANSDGLDDSAQAPGGVPFVQDGSIAIVDTGDSSVNDFGARLTGLGYTVSTIPMNSNYSVLIQYDSVLLPVSHGATCCYANFDALAEDYLRYVYDGGCLYIAQPNPFDHPGAEAVITWVPFALRLDAFYDIADCPPAIVDPEHCVAQGLSGSDLPFPGDTVLEMGPEWEVVTVGQATGSPGVLTGAYGSGSINVELAHPSGAALCPYSDAGLLNMVECCLGPPPVATQKATWGGLKALYR